jgi:hypothetical protein
MSIVLALAVSPSFALLTYQQGVSPSGAYEHEGTQIWSVASTFRTGGDSHIRVGRGTTNEGDTAIRGLLSFDLTGVPLGHIVTSAQLTMTINDPGDGTPGAVTLHRLNGPGPFEEGIGGFGNTSGNGATWTQYEGTNLWNTAGGDFDGGVLSSVPGSGGGSGSQGDQHIFASSAAFVAAANDALTNKGGLLELILIGDEGTGPNNFWRYASDDEAVSSRRPLLEIETAIPEPATMALLGIGGLMVLRRRRRT